MQQFIDTTDASDDPADERPSDCTQCAVRASTLFSDLEEWELEAHLHTIRNAFWSTDAVIYRAGAPARDVFSIRSGVVKLLDGASTRSNRIVRLLGRGAAIGLEALDGPTYANTAVVTRESNLCRIPRSALLEIDPKNPRLSRGLISKWREHAARAEALMGSIHGGSLDARATALLRLCIDVSRDPPNAVRLLKNEDMANLLGVSKESISRCVANLKRTGSIRRVGPWTYDCTLILAQ
jgi:CRP-like cAMP-binding protein